MFGVKNTNCCQRWDLRGTSSPRRCHLVVDAESENGFHTERNGFEGPTAPKKTAAQTTPEE
jgi:hypothetical protein